MLEIRILFQSKKNLQLKKCSEFRHICSKPKSQYQLKLDSWLFARYPATGTVFEYVTKYLVGTYINFSEYHSRKE